MASGQTSKSSEQHKTHHLPGWLRFVFIGLGLICLGILAFIWIKGVSNDLDKVMTAIFVSLTATFAFLTMPFLYHSESSQPLDQPISPTFPSMQINVNQFQSNVQESSFPTASDSSNMDSKEPYGHTTTPNNKTQDQQYSSMGDVSNDNQPLETVSEMRHSTPSNKPVAHSSLTGKHNVLDSTFFDEMVRTLEGLPATASFQGRSALLIGLPRNIVSGLQRDSNSDANDLENILTQLDGLGPLETGDQPLIIFIQNALRRAEGLASSRSLNTILEELKQRYGLF